jgi:excisionase family DNA binding protein
MGTGNERVLYHPRNFAARTDLSPSMVYKMVANGSLHSVRIGRSVRIPASELDRVLAGEVRA